MKALLSVLILASVLTAFAGPHPRPHSRPQQHHSAHREVALAQKQKERDFVLARRAIERIRMAI